MQRRNFISGALAIGAAAVVGVPVAAKAGTPVGNIYYLKDKGGKLVYATHLRTRAQFYQDMLNSGVMSANDIRKMEDKGRIAA